MILSVAADGHTTTDEEDAQINTPPSAAARRSLLLSFFLSYLAADFLEVAAVAEVAVVLFMPVGLLQALPSRSR